jgi:hypothetical protein
LLNEENRVVWSIMTIQKSLEEHDEEEEGGGKNRPKGVDEDGRSRQKTTTEPGSGNLPGNGGSTGGTPLNK